MLEEKPVRVEHEGASQLRLEHEGADADPECGEVEHGRSAAGALSCCLVVATPSRRAMRRWRVPVPKQKPCVSRRRCAVATLRGMLYEPWVPIGSARRSLGGPGGWADLVRSGL